MNDDDNSAAIHRNTAGFSRRRHPEGVVCEYLDKRTPQEMERHMAGSGVAAERLHPIENWREVFPDGAAFILAYNVLEHIPNPISALLEWHSMMRDDAIVVLSVSQVGNGPDKRHKNRMSRW